MIYHDLKNVHKHEKCQFVCQKRCLQKVQLGFEIQQVSLKQKLNDEVFTHRTMPPATGRHSKRGIMDRTSQRTG